MNRNKIPPHPQQPVTISRELIALATKRGLSKTNELNEIIKPLSQLNIQNFSYCKYIKSRRVLHLNSNTNFLELYLKKIFRYNESNFSENFLNMQLPFVFSSHNTAIATNKNNQILYDMYDMGMKETITLLTSDKTTNITEIFCFYIDSESDCIYKQPPQIDNFVKFIMYFKEKSNAFCNDIIIKPSEIKKINKQNALEDSSYNNFIARDESSSFDVDIKEYHFGNPFVLPLRQREYECLKMAYIGMTAKQIAKELQISFRTVEKHLISLRQKANNIDFNILRQQLYHNPIFQALIKASVVSSSMT